MTKRTHRLKWKEERKDEKIKRSDGGGKVVGRTLQAKIKEGREKME